MQVMTDLTLMIGVSITTPMKVYQEIMSQRKHWRTIDEFLQGMPPGHQETQQKDVGIAPAGTNLYIMSKKRQ
jgi:hypothetical protein